MGARTMVARATDSSRKFQDASYASTDVCERNAWPGSGVIENDPLRSSASAALILFEIAIV
jgi:hypothetical protein